MRSKVFITTAPSPHYNGPKRIFPDPRGFVENLGLGYLEASLKGICDCATLDAGQFQLSHDETTRLAFKALKGYDKKYLAISAYSHMGQSARKLGKIAKRFDPGITVILGGYGPSQFPDDYTSIADYVCIGEGDIVFPNLIRALSSNATVQDTRGVATKEFINERERLAVLDDLPFPARKGYTLLNTFFGKHIPELAFQTSRGCIASCGFCERIYVQPGYRERSIDSVVEEIEIVNNSRFEELSLWLTDLNFLSKAQRVADIIERMKERGINTYVGGCTRVTDIIRDKDIISNYRGHFHKIDLGIESFDDKFLTKWNKGYDSKTAIEGIKILDELKIPYRMFMIGIDETTTYDDALRHYGALKSMPKHFWIHMVDFPTKRISYDAKTDDQKYSDNQIAFSDLGFLIRWRDFQNIFSEVFYMKAKNEIIEDPRFQTMVNKAADYCCEVYLYGAECLELEEQVLLHMRSDTLKKSGHAKAFEEVYKKFASNMDSFLRVKFEEIEKKKENAPKLLEIIHTINTSNEQKRNVLRELHRIDPNNPVYMLDMVYFMSDLSPKHWRSVARKYFKDLKPDSFGPLLASYAFGVDTCVSLMPKYLDKSYELLKASLEKNRASTSLLFMGEYYSRKKDNEKCKQYCKEFNDLFPTGILGLTSLASVSQKLGDTQQVKDCYRTLIRMGIPKKRLPKEIFKPYL